MHKTALTQAWLNDSNRTLDTIRTIEEIWDDEEIVPYQTLISLRKLVVLFETNPTQFDIEFNRQRDSERPGLRTLITQIEYYYYYGMYHEAWLICRVALEEIEREKPEGDLLAKLPNIKLIMQLCVNYQGLY